VISVIVYGRNDSYGYNLHKRAAISLNCIAELLPDASDEVLFVDYNSPDDLPTFPEAIQDTLTRKAKDKLRILRVRGSVHERFRNKTHLDAIEPVARNVAVRRSNPQNRWILSTNTDIIVVPRKKPSLSEIVADLPRGFYHVPRFEVPESLWESFDRTNPRQTISEVRNLGVSARLNEVVLSDVILYDGPGDFQLIERADLFAIDGFDEEMILGWHVDSNLAKRLILKHGRVSSLLAEVFCYHCDHTRWSTVAHSGERIENDWGRFVEETTGPELPGQRDHWGCRDTAVEEIRLAPDGAHPYRDLLRSVVAPLEREYTESSFTPRSFDSYDYEPGHVLPFIADLLKSHDRDASLAWCGARADMFDLVCQAWRLLGFRNPILVDEANSAVVGGRPPGAWQIASRGEWLRRADLLVFEFGRAGTTAPGAGGSELTATGLNALQSVRAGFLDAVAAERSRLSDAAAAPRRFIGINCIHNSMEGLFSAHIGITRTPFSSHLRHGFLLRPSAISGADTELVSRAIGEILGRTGPITLKELGLARYLFMPLLEGGEIAPPLRHRAAGNAVLGRAFLEIVGNPQRASPLPAATARAIAALEGLRPSSRFAARPGVIVTDQPGPASDQRPLSRFAAYEDWDDPSWSRFLEPDAKGADGFSRSTPVWERAHLLYALDRLWKLSTRSRVLVAVTMPDPIIADLGERVGRLELLDLAKERQYRSAAEAWREYSGGSARPPYAPDRHHILDPQTGLHRLEHEAYDVVLFPHGSMFIDGRDRAVDLIEAAERLLKPDGILAFKAEVAADDSPHDEFFDAGFTAERGFAAQLALATGLVAEAGFDARVYRATVDKVCPETGPVPGEEYFLSWDGDRMLIPSLWFLRKHRATPQNGWERLRRWIAARFFGEQIGRLRVGPAGRRLRNGAIATIPGQDGHVFYGPYLAFPGGRYRLTATVDGIEDPAELGLQIEAVADPSIFAATSLDRRTLRSGAFTTDFAVPPDGDGLLEIRVTSPGLGEAVFTSIDVRPLDGSDDRDGGIAPVEPSPIEAPDIPDADSIPDSSEAVELPPAPAVGIAPEDREPADGERPLSRFVAYEDWDDPAWRLFLPRGAARSYRSWERAHLLYGLDRAGKLNLRTRIAVVAMQPDAIVAILSERTGRVDVLDLRGDEPRIGAEGRLFWSEGALYSRNRLRILARTGPAGLEAHAYDAVVFPHGSLFDAGLAGVARLLAMAERAVVEGGLVVFQAEFDEPARADPGRPDQRLLGEAGLAARLAAGTGLWAEGGFDMAVSSATRKHAAELLLQRDDRMLVPSLWFLRKRAATSAAGWEGLERWLGSQSLGEQIHRLRIGPAGRREEGRSSIAAIPGRHGHVFYGPYLSLPRGAYEASLDFEPRRGGCGRISVEIVAGSKKFASKRIALNHNTARRVSLRFAIPAALGKIEIRASTDGGDAVFRGCRLDRLD